MDWRLEGAAELSKGLLSHRWSKAEGEGNWIGGSPSGGTGSGLESRRAALFGLSGAHPSTSLLLQGWQALPFPRNPSSWPLPNLITPISCPLVILLAAS